MKKVLFFLLSLLILNEKALCQNKGQDISNLSLDSPGGFEHIQPSIAQDGRTLFLQVQFDF
ncbi:MAG: hypothetical protein KJ666_10715 [Bacteroidetes bacterium]|nr:hypothetical protein [Bacteroidota bacterium]MBU2583914.1 hypothetical protein [Bacteroidota bacterium]